MAYWIPEQGKGIRVFFPTTGSLLYAVDLAGTV
jgi:hypothetical protein